MSTLWQHLHGMQIFLVDAAAEQPPKKGQKRHFGCFSPFFEGFGLASSHYKCSGHTNELQKGANTVFAPFWHHLHGMQIFLVDVAAEKPPKKCQKRHFGRFSHFLEGFGLASSHYKCSGHTSELQ